MSSAPQSPRRWEWTMALAIFAIAAVGLFIVSSPTNPWDLGGDQMNIVTVLMKQTDPALFPRDYVLGDLGNVRFYPPLFGWIATEASRVAGGDWVLGFRLLLVPIAFAYLVVMYVFLRSVVPSGLVAILVALVSLPATKTLGATYWGIGPARYVVPRTVFLPLVPLAVWLYRRWENGWKLVGLFGLLGLSANLHPVSALGLAGVLGLTHWLRHGLRRGGWVRLGCCGLAFAACAVPFVLRFRSGTAGAAAAVDGAQVNRIMRERVPHQFPSTMPLGFPLVGGWVLAAAAAGAAWRVLRRATDDRDRFLGCFAVGVLACSVGAMALVEFAARVSGRPYWVVNLMRTWKLIYVVLFAYVALLLADLVAQRTLWPRLLGILLAACFAVEGACRAQATIRFDRFTRELVYGRRQVNPRLRPLARMCEAVRKATPKDTLLHFAGSDAKLETLCLRFLAERSVTVSWKDAGYLWYADKARLVEWHGRVTRMHKEREAGNPRQVAATARDYGADYVIVPSAWGPLELPVLYHDPEGYSVYDVHGAQRR